MKVGIIGVGKFGENHVRIIKELGHEVYIDDANSERKAEVAEEYGVVDLLIPKIMDAIIVATSTDTHYTIAKRLLEDAISIMVEKPLCLHADEAEELIKLAQKNDTILATGTVFRFTPAAFEIQKIVENLDIEGIRMRFYNKKPQRTDSNIIFNLGTHLIDLLLLCNLEITKEKVDIFDDWCIIELSAKRKYCKDCKSFPVKIYLQCNAPEKTRDIRIVTRAGIINLDLSIVSDTEPLVFEDIHFLNCIKTGIDPINIADAKLIKILEELSAR